MSRYLLIKQYWLWELVEQDLKRFILWAATNFDLPILPDFIAAPPTAELEPITADYVQSDGKSFPALILRRFWGGARSWATVSFPPLHMFFSSANR